MAYFRSLPRKEDLLALFSKQERWLILVVADPDALASAMALKRIMAHRVQEVGISHVNEITRPDNLEMIDSLRVPTRRFSPKLLKKYDKFALVDSQPHHNEAFKDIPFTIIMDHHRQVEDHPVEAPFVHIEPSYGANSSLLVEYLYNLSIRPGKLLATALQYGIKTDTSSFERDFAEVDLRAFQYLNKFASTLLLRKIYRSEFHMEWLRYLCQAYFKMRLSGQGIFAHLEHVESSDVLVIVADLFTRVHGTSWTAVSGVVNDKIVIIFRGDGLRRDMGKFAARCFGDLGSAGGHKGAARAEFPLSAVDDLSVESFIWKRLHINKPRAKKSDAPKPDQE